MIPQRDQLLGYLLGALDATERSAVEAAVRIDPRLRDELELLQNSLQPLGFPQRDDEFSLDGPPPGLAQRTLDFLEDHAFDLRPSPAAPVAGTTVGTGGRRTSTAVRNMSPDSVPNPVGSRRADVLAAAGVLLSLAALLFPAVAGMRTASQSSACRENLRQIGTSLSEFGALSPDRRIPSIPRYGNRAVAGVYAPVLWEGGFLNHIGSVICPSSPLAREVEAFRLPTLYEIDRASGETLAQWQRRMGGSYAYTLGYLEENSIQAPRMDGSAQFGIMTDAPNLQRIALASTNHGSRGQNMLFADHHVRFVSSSIDSLLDDPFRNRSGMIAAGEDAADVVLGESSARAYSRFFDLRP